MKRTGLRRTLLIGVLAFGALLVGATIASADHSWNGYHWPSGNLAPTVVDDTSSSLYNVPAGVMEWANLGTPIQPALTTANKGDITVREAFSPFWLGLARIFVEDGHITKGEVKLNTRLLNNYGADAADHVLCQELGHVLGLDHNPDGATGGTPDNTCMNGAEHLGDYTSPNSHDTDQLNLIYNHTDVTDGGGDDGGGGGGPPCDRNPDHPRCASGNGVWITVHVFPAP